MVFEYIIRYSPRRRASHPVAEGFSPTASPVYRINFSKTIRAGALPVALKGPGPGCAGLRSASAGGWGNPVSPSPCARAAPSQTLPRAGVWGNLVPPWSRETVMRTAHNARCTWPGSAGVPPAPRLRGHGVAPLPIPPPAGGRESGASPQRGEAGRGAERGERWSPQPSRSQGSAIMPRWNGSEPRGAPLAPLAPARSTERHCHATDHRSPR